MNLLSIRIDERMDLALERLARETHRPKSQVVHDLLEAQLSLLAFEQARVALQPLAESVGWRTDEDVFRAVS
ncbi:MAG: ribbon-helix-helix domain-containing protein [Xanthomonadales bacterium]|jgi:predicted transcriptional regulator|nr:ribbon-helix-helix domain-containing protein [Xanthomonadales bacterium]